MANISVPYLKLRDGRPRWEPGPSLRDNDFKGRDLKDEAGRWLGLQAAIEAAEALNADVAAWRAGGGRRRRPPVSRKPARCCRQLFEIWQATPEFRQLAPRTRKDYACKAEVFLADFELAPVAAIGPKVLRNYWRAQFDARGHAMANGIMAVVRAMLTHAKQEEWIAVNPAFDLGLMKVPPRVVIWLAAEITAMVAAADSMGLHSIGDAIILGLHTGQRQGDVLSFETPRIESNRALFRQSKRGARVSVPYTDVLRQRIEAIRQRRTAGAGQVTDLTTLRHLVMAEGTGQPYSGRLFNQKFRAVRERVAERLPAVAGKQFMDFRDTAITRLWWAQCTLMEIRSITGHSMATIHDVMTHYVTVDDTMSAAAISKVQAWMTDEGVAI